MIAALAVLVALPVAAFEDQIFEDQVQELSRAARGALFETRAVLAPPASALEQRIAELTRQAAPEVAAWRRDIHQNPELSNRETRTGALVAGELAAMGVDDLRTGVANHGSVAVIRGRHPGPTIALRADMDALPIMERTGLSFSSRVPGVMHACGHDGHTAILLGAARVLTQLRDEMHGNVKLIFQPAEEGAPPGEEAGAKLMIKEGVLRSPDVAAILALHATTLAPVGKLAYVFGAAMASADRFKIVVRGKGSHGAAPWQGVDPLYVSARIIDGIQSIASRETDARQTVVVTVGSIQGGNRYNIIPDTVVMEGTIRTLDDKVREQALEAFQRIVKLTSEAHRATSEVEIANYAPTLVNDAELGRAVLPSLQATVGPENLIANQQSTGGEDFAFFAREVPGFYFWLGVRPPDRAVGGAHTDTFDLDENALPLGVRALAQSALDWLRQHPAAGSPAGASVVGLAP